MNAHKMAAEICNNLSSKAVEEYLYPMTFVRWYDIETRFEVLPGIFCEPIEIYSQLNVRGLSKGYRMKSFCGIDRFALDAAFPEDLFEQRRQRTIGAIGEREVVRQIIQMAIEFHGEDIVNSELFGKAVAEMSIAWLRLIVHQLWLGRKREQIAKELFEELLPEGVRYVLSSKEQDTQNRFDASLMNHAGETVALISVKSKRYFYKKSSTFRDAGRLEEHAAHAKNSLPTHEILVNENDVPATRSSIYTLIQQMFHTP